jgi:Nif-specific regulatory protein
MSEQLSLGFDETQTMTNIFTEPGFGPSAAKVSDVIESGLPPVPAKRFSCEVADCTTRSLIVFAGRSGAAGTARTARLPSASTVSPPMPPGRVTSTAPGRITFRLPFASTPAAAPLAASVMLTGFGGLGFFAPTVGGAATSAPRSIEPISLAHGPAPGTSGARRSVADDARGGVQAAIVSSPPANRLQLLYELGCAFAERIELDELVPLVMTKCRDVLDAEGGSVLLLDADTSTFVFPYVADQNPGAAERLAAMRVPVEHSIAGAVVREGRPIRVDAAHNDPRFYAEVDRQTGVRTGSLLAAPLRARHGIIGVIEVVNRRGGGTFTDDDLAFLDALAGSVAVAIENARLYEQVKASEERLRTQVGALRRDLARRDRFTEIVGTGPAMGDVFHLMESAAASPITVLIEGETGTGKELVARAIHRESARADHPFLAVNCAAFQETLLESELFGHRRGAFTGAVQDRRGLFEAADKGTVFLDEIGEMPPAMQAKLLRVLELGEVVPVGDTKPRKVDVRVISATNRNLTVEVAERRFREDLYYRLVAFPIRLPPLRTRREDIPLLAQRFVAAAAERHRKRIPGIEPAAIDRLVRFDWPGNVRELRNEIERAVALARDGEAIAPSHLSEKLLATAEVPAEAAALGAPAATGGAALLRARAAFEARYIGEVLRQQKGNVSHAAKALGLSRVMLQRKMKVYGLR